MSNCAVCHKPVKSGVVVHSECMEQLRKAQQLDDKPLTIEELREMVGEPVWVQPLVGRWHAHWAIIHGEVASDGRLPGDKEKCLVSFMETGGYGSLWLAYRRKPREWISVKKRPPEYDAPVWGWDAQCHCAKEVNYLNGEFFDVFGEDADITHWMPLPAPPEVE